MEYLPSDQSARPTAGVSEPLRFGQVCLLPSQLLGQQLVLSHVNCGAEKPFEGVLIEHRYANGANVAYLAIRANEARRHVAAPTVGVHLTDGAGHGGAVCRMYPGQTALERRRPVLWVKVEEFVQSLGPIAVPVVGRP